jgi:CheY-like chemotaxis protein
VDGQPSGYRANNRCVPQHAQKLADHHAEKIRGTARKQSLNFGKRAIQDAESDREPMQKGVKTVLVVDDSPLVRHTVRSALFSDGFTVCGEANDGREAIELAGKLSPELIILDMSMPIMNGLQAVPVLRKLVPNSPIILFTVYTDTAVEQQLRTIDVDAVLSKREPLSNLLEKGACSPW